MTKVGWRTHLERLQFLVTLSVNNFGLPGRNLSNVGKITNVG